MKSHRIFTDKVSGRDLDRPGQSLLQLKVEKVDVILIKKFDRLGRDTVNVIQLIKGFDENGVAVRILDDGISTEGMKGNMVVTILSAVAQAKRERILERTNAERFEAKNRGVKFGRKQSVYRRQMLKLHRSDTRAAEITQRMNIVQSTMYKILDETG